MAATVTCLQQRQPPKGPLQALPLQAGNAGWPPMPCTRIETPQVHKACKARTLAPCSEVTLTSQLGILQTTHEHRVVGPRFSTHGPTQPHRWRIGVFPPGRPRSPAQHRPGMGQGADTHPRRDPLAQRPWSRRGPATKHAQVRSRLRDPQVQPTKTKLSKTHTSQSKNATTTVLSSTEHSWKSRS